MSGSYLDSSRLLSGSCLGWTLAAGLRISDIRPVAHFCPAVALLGNNCPEACLKTLFGWSYTTPAAQHPGESSGLKWGLRLLRLRRSDWQQRPECVVGIRKARTQDTNGRQGRREANKEGGVGVRVTGSGPTRGMPVLRGADKGESESESEIQGADPIDNARA
eukprot:365151-Chlamydomonas_euryale.AAC.15